MEKKYPWGGCGASKDITGCRFSLSVMSDNYVSMILDAIKNVDTKKVWSETDALSTVYRGKRNHVMNCLNSVFTQVNDGKTHITMEAAISKGCPGDVDSDSYLAQDDVLLNDNTKKFNVLSKIAFYPLGDSQYMDKIADAVNMAMDMGVFKRTSHYATELQGDVNDVFRCLEKILEYAEKNTAHYVLQITLSANSPSLLQKE